MKEWTLTMYCDGCRLERIYSGDVVTAILQRVRKGGWKLGTTKDFCKWCQEDGQATDDDVQEVG